MDEIQFPHFFFFSNKQIEASCIATSDILEKNALPTIGRKSSKWHFYTICRPADLIVDVGFVCVLEVSLLPKRLRHSE